MPSSLEGARISSSPTMSSSRLVARLLLVAIMCCASSHTRMVLPRRRCTLELASRAGVHAEGRAVGDAEEAVADVHARLRWAGARGARRRNAHQHGHLDGAGGVEPLVAAVVPVGVRVVVVVGDGDGLRPGVLPDAPDRLCQLVLFLGAHRVGTRIESPAAGFAAAGSAGRFAGLAPPGHGFLPPARGGGYLGTGNLAGAETRNAEAAMGRILVIVCALGLLAGNAAAQEPWLERTTLAEDSLAGPVRSVEVRTTRTTDGRRAGPPRRYEEVTRVEYDRAGRRTELVRTDSGVVTSRIVYTSRRGRPQHGARPLRRHRRAPAAGLHVRRAGRGGGKADHRRDRGEGALRPRRGGEAAGERARGRPPHGRTATTSGAGAWRRCTGWRTAPCWGPRGGSTAPAGPVRETRIDGGGRVLLGLRDALRRGRAGWRSGRSARRTRWGGFPPRTRRFPGAR